MTTLRLYLMGVRFTVYTANFSLRLFMSISDPSGRLMRWRICLAEYEFQVIYKKDVQNTQADDLSRLPCSAEALQTEDKDIPFFIAGEPDNRKEAAEARPENWDDNADFDNLLALRDESENPLPGKFVPKSPEEMIRQKFCNLLSARIRARINDGEDLLFGVNDKGHPVKKVNTHPQIALKTFSSCLA